MLESSGDARWLSRIPGLMGLLIGVTSILMSIELSLLESSSDRCELDVDGLSTFADL